LSAKLEVEKAEYEKEENKENEDVVPASESTADLVPAPESNAVPVRDVPVPESKSDGNVVISADISASENKHDNNELQKTDESIGEKLNKRDGFVHNEKRLGIENRGLGMEMENDLLWKHINGTCQILCMLSENSKNKDSYVFLDIKNKICDWQEVNEKHTSTKPANEEILLYQNKILKNQVTILSNGYKTYLETPSVQDSCETASSISINIYTKLMATFYVLDEE
jgi:hypothetical protein